LRRLCDKGEAAHWSCPDLGGNLRSKLQKLKLAVEAGQATSTPLPNNAIMADPLDWHLRMCRWHENCLLPLIWWAWACFCCIWFCFLPRRVAHIAISHHLQMGVGYERALSLLLLRECIWSSLFTLLCLSSWSLFAVRVRGGGGWRDWIDEWLP
jgi:hypothetical protein